jgi:hypothetical protein
MFDKLTPMGAIIGTSFSGYGFSTCYARSSSSRAKRGGLVAKEKKKRPARKPYTASDVKLLRRHSKARTPVSKIAKLMRRSEGSLRQKALTLGIGLGHLR